MIIDFHSHILPYADHGSSSLEVSLKQIQYSNEANIDYLVATPHFYANQDTIESFHCKVSNSLNILNKYITGTSPKILVGSEILLFEGMHHMENLDSLCIHNTNCLLIEMPYVDWSNNLITTLYEISSCGAYNVVIAHIDRYKKEQLDKLCGLKVNMQINCDSIVNPLKWTHIKKYFSYYNIVAIGSDIHGSSKSPYHKFKRAMHKCPDIEKIMHASATILDLL